MRGLILEKTVKGKTPEEDLNKSVIDVKNGKERPAIDKYENCCKPIIKLKTAEEEE